MAPRPPIDLKSFSDYLLDHELDSRFIKSAEDFWSERTIEDLLQRDIVCTLLSKANEPYENALIDFILNDARKLFAITASLDTDHDQLVKIMKFFRSNGFRDSQLSSETGKGGVLMEDRNSLGDNLRKLEKLDSGLWRTTMLKRFCETRWKVIVPEFSTSRDNYDLKEDTILPFLEVVEKDEFGKKKQRSGAFSTVHQVEIHEGYYKDHFPKNEWPKYFAVKEIRPPGNDERIRVDEVWSNEANTLRAMNKRNNENILRFITAFTMGDDESLRSYYLIFEWADGGSLEDVWKQNPNPALDGKLVKEWAEQLLGLARALETTHDVAKVRHGDLKPDNILRFQHTPDKILGTLKIGDWGLAKYHANSTVARAELGEKTTTRYSTRLYEPPEVVLGDVKILGRQFDVWSMGCVILELIIWLLYGYRYVERFRDDVKGQSIEGVPCYEVNSAADNLVKARLRTVVVKWIEYIDNDPACEDYTAMGELMALIRTRLLIIELPEERGQTRYVRDWEVPARNAPSAGAPVFSFRAPTSLSKDDFDLKGIQRHRATSAELVKKLDPKEEGLLNDDDRPENYWFWEPLGYQRKGPPEFSTRLFQDDTGHLIPGPTTRIQQQPKNMQRSGLTSGMGHLMVQNRNLLDDEWEIHIDNNFARNVASHVGDAAILGVPKLEEPSNLCDSCQNFDIFETLGFKVKYDPADLEERSKNCDLCRLFWKIYRRDRGNRPGTVFFERVQSSLRMNGAVIPALSICRTLDSKNRQNIQIGFPRLPEAGSPAHFEVIRQWLKLCDDIKIHPNCHPSRPATSSMPTRLINVGKEGDLFVRVWEPGLEDTCEYIALSHPWGHEPFFVTDVNNVEQHKDGITVNNLPATFRDAVTTTRALGKQYLWIDSICIIQGPGGDFEDQAKKMETVFSCAYCVLVASCAYNQTDGFLQPRRGRDYVTLREKDGAPFYICENIDSFDSHVLKGHLNKRGWVLQEHALARRSVFFTETQTYFECGDGVRCETLTKMRNNLASFLGDPNFPRIIMSARQGEKIIRFQNLYRTYSALAFTKDYDRPIAMDGIQNRLLAAFGTPGGFGVFDEENPPGTNSSRDQKHRGLLRRSLLWYRPHSKNDLARIAFPSDRSTIVPSWSWMAYVGEIDFLNPEFGNIDWKDLRSPWSRMESPMLGKTEGNMIEDMSLRGELRDVSYDTQSKDLGKLFFDRGEPSTTAVQCVVLGVQHRSLGSNLCYFLLVVPTDDRGPDENRVYERIGAGYLPSRCISSAKYEIKII